MSLLDHFTPDEIAAELRRLGYTVTPPSSPPRPSSVVFQQPPPSWLVADDDGVTMLGRGADDE